MSWPTHVSNLFWIHLSEWLSTGLPQKALRPGGPALLETLYADPARLKEFLGGMSGISRGANTAIARMFPWNDQRTFVDVGTAQGDLAVQIAVTNPHLEGIGCDLPEVAPIFQDYVSSHGLSARLRFEPGDFFNASYPKLMSF